jgi:beta-glucosidase
MLYWKFKLGLFDRPYVDAEEAKRVVGCSEHRNMALQAARETITLLKNENSLLPLDPSKLKTIAVVGPNSNRVLLGGYSGLPKQNVTVLEGILTRVGKAVNVLHAEGCKITRGGSWQQDVVLASDPEEDRRLIAEAVYLARRADVIVLAIGENEQTSREAWSLHHMGDRANLNLLGVQEELVKALVATGKPLVVLLFNGRPLAIPAVAEAVPAIVECWYLGQECGRAVAEVLFGDVNPGGKLPISLPRSVGHVPAFYNHKPSARRGYLWDDVSPVFPFGFGLSYTKFQLGTPRLGKTKIRRNAATHVLVDVTNNGKRAGSEVVQMYVRDRVSSVTRPVKELKGFRKIWLEPGETQTVKIDIDTESLAFYDLKMEYAVEPGEFEIMVGTSSRNSDLQSVVLTVMG